MPPVSFCFAAALVGSYSLIPTHSSEGACEVKGNESKSREMTPSIDAVELSEVFDTISGANDQGGVCVRGTDLLAADRHLPVDLPATLPTPIPMAQECNSLPVTHENVKWRISNCLRTAPPVGIATIELPVFLFTNDE